MPTPTLTTHCQKLSPFIADPAFAELLLAFEAELQPVGMLEILHASEILHANWRLRDLRRIDEARLDEPSRLSLELARMRTKSMLRRDTADLRRLQTERQVRAEIGTSLTGLASSRDLVEIARAVRTAPAQRRPDPENPEIARLEALIHARLQQEETGRPASPNNLKIRTQSAPRNAACPCGSGQKYKRCCGHWTQTANKTAA